MMHDASRLLREKHELEANVVRKMDERVILFETVRERRKRERTKRGRKEREREKKEREKREKREREKESKNIPHQQQLRDPSKAKHEPELVDLHGAGGDGAGQKQLLQRQQLPQSPHLQEELSSDGCYARNDEEFPPKQPSSLPPLSPPPPPPPPPSSSLPPSWSPPLSSPPSPPLPSPLPTPPMVPLLPLYLQARSTARPVPESVATLVCTTKEKMRDGTTWPADAGREVEEISSAIAHAYEFWNNVETAVVRADGRVCTIDWGSEHGQKRTGCPKRARVKEKRTMGHQRRL